MSKLENFVTYLDKIAEKNNNEFIYKLEIEPKSNIRYTFLCEEFADKHAFAIGYGQTIEECLISAEDSVKDSLENWGYKDVQR